MERLAAQRCNKSVDIAGGYIGELNNYGHQHHRGNEVRHVHDHLRTFTKSDGTTFVHENDKQDRKRKERTSTTLLKKESMTARMPNEAVSHPGTKTLLCVFASDRQYIPKRRRAAGQCADGSALRSERSLLSEGSRCLALCRQLLAFSIFI